MRLFNDDPRASGFVSRFSFHQPAPVPETRAEDFRGWPRHMQGEFLALAREAGFSDAAIRRETGLTKSDLTRAREAHAKPYLLPAAAGHHYDETRPLMRQEADDAG